MAGNRVITLPAAGLATGVNYKIKTIFIKINILQKLEPLTMRVIVSHVKTSAVKPINLKRKKKHVCPVSNILQVSEAISINSGKA